MLIGPWAGLEKAPLDWLKGIKYVSSLSGSRTSPGTGILAQELQAVPGLKVGFHQGPAPSHPGTCLPPAAITIHWECDLPCK